ncbi:MAG: molybdopterin cofactor-binding domain-containing protein [Alcaligenaceae bacterium]
MTLATTVTANPELATNPTLASWVKVESDGTIRLKVGKVELGQGIHIAQLQIAADELEVPLTQLDITAGNTDLCPDQGYTSGSNSVQVGLMALRQVCAEVRHAFVQAAAQRLNLPDHEVQVKDGVFFQKNQSPFFVDLSYATLASSVDLSIQATGLIKPKDVASRHTTGQSPKRPDLQHKLFGAGYIQDFELPDMLHARIVHPPSYSAQVIEFDEASQQAIKRLPGVHTLFVSGRLIGVCAEREEQAIAAAKAISKAIKWQESASLPKEEPSQAWLRTLPTADSIVSEKDSAQDSAFKRATAKISAEAGSGSALAATASVRRQHFSANYSKPFLAHGSIGPSCALAHWSDQHLTVWTHGQGSFPMRRELATLCGMKLDQVTVIHMDGAGCYGHNGADDAGFEAAVLAREAGRPVRLQWMREDEFNWSPHGSAMSVQIDAELNEQGKIVSWHHQTWSHTHVQRPGMSSGLRSLAAAHRMPPAPTPEVSDFALATGGGGTRNAVPLYTFAKHKIDYHLVQATTLRSSALRALGAYANVFAIESCMDELASLAQNDPIAFRLAHLEDPRAAEVLKTVARMANWQEKKLQPTNKDATVGRGVAFARYKNTGAYCAMVIDIEVTDRIILDRIWVAVDAGEVIHPDGLVNQIEGGVLQAASWTLIEGLHWDTTRITSNTWDQYPILGFAHTPRALEVSCVSRPEDPPLGVGECAAGPTAAALANALANALGVRMRDLPLTPERLEQAAQQS